MAAAISGKNYSIEFYRIIATLIICAHHLYQFPLYYSNLAVCVEFFFILSGYFLMSSYDREQRHSCIEFGKKRFLRLYPEYFLAYLILIAGIVIFRGEHIRPDVVVPELLFLKSTGLFYDGYNYPGWYVCTLFWSEIIFYNLIFCNRRRFTHIIAPLLVLFGYTWLFNCGKGLGNLEIWESFYPMLRAMCGLSLGVLIYEVQRNGCMSGMRLWQGTVVEVVSLGVIVYSLTTDENLWALAILGFIFLLLVTVQQRGYLSAVILNQKIFGAVSRISYGMYLNQALMILLVWSVVGRNYGAKAWGVYYISLVAVSTVLWFASGQIMKWFRKKKEI